MSLASEKSITHSSQENGLIRETKSQLVLMKRAKITESKDDER